MDSSKIESIIRNWSDAVTNDGAASSRSSYRSAAVEELVKKYTKEITSSDHQGTIIRPWSYEDFLSRLATFSKSFAWFAKPQLISPLQCSRYGWCNSGKDEISCSGCCGKTLKHLPGVDPDGSKLFAELSSGHESHCGWVNNFSPDEFLQFPVTSTSNLRRDFLRRLRGLLLVLVEEIIAISGSSAEHDHENAEHENAEHENAVDGNYNEGSKNGVKIKVQVPAEVVTVAPHLYNWLSEQSTNYDAPDVDGYFGAETSLTESPSSSLSAAASAAATTGDSNATTTAATTVPPPVIVIEISQSQLTSSVHGIQAAATAVINRIDAIIRDEVNHISGHVLTDLSDAVLLSSSSSSLSSSSPLSSAAVAVGVAVRGGGGGVAVAVGVRGGGGGGVDSEECPAVVTSKLLRVAVLLAICGFEKQPQTTAKNDRSSTLPSDSSPSATTDASTTRGTTSTYNLHCGFCSRSFGVRMLDPTTVLSGGGSPCKTISGGVITHNINKGKERARLPLDPLQQHRSFCLWSHSYDRVKLPAATAAATATAATATAATITASTADIATSRTTISCSAAAGASFITTTTAVSTVAVAASTAVAVGVEEVSLPGWKIVATAVCGEESSYAVADSGSRKRLSVSSAHGTATVNDGSSSKRRRYSDTVATPSASSSSPSSSTSAEVVAASAAVGSGGAEGVLRLSSASEPSSLSPEQLYKKIRAVMDLATTAGTVVPPLKYGM